MWRGGRRPGRSGRRCSRGCAADQDVAEQARAQCLDHLAAGEASLVRGNGAAAGDGTTGGAEQPARGPHHRLGKGRQLRPAPLQVAVEQAPHRPQQHAVGAGQDQAGVGDAVGAHHLQPRVVRRPGRDHQGPPLQGEAVEPAQHLEAAELGQPHGDHGELAAAAGHDLVGRGTIGGDLDPILAGQGRGGGAQPVGLRMGQQQGRRIARQLRIGGAGLGHVGAHPPPGAGRHEAKPPF